MILLKMANLKLHCFSFVVVCIFVLLVLDPTVFRESILGIYNFDRDFDFIFQLTSNHVL